MPGPSLLPDDACAAEVRAHDKMNAVEAKDLRSNGKSLIVLIAAK